MTSTGWWFTVVFSMWTSVVVQLNCATVEHSGDHQNSGNAILHEAPEWSYYGPNGPANWSLDYPDCAKHRQSPIDLRPSEATLDDRLDEIQMVFAYEEDQNHTIRISNNGFSVNNGHSVYLFLSSVMIRLSGAKLGSSYRVAGVHFHWGRDDSEGSEHTINGTKYPLEMHVVCYDEEHYASLNEAMTVMKAADSLAVIGELFQISDTDNPQLAPLIDILGNITTPGYSATFTNFDLKTLLPKRLTDYYRYAGSLTTPPCFEKVVWSVLSSISSVSKAQLAKFRSLQLQGPIENRPKIQSNWRATQPLNGRTVHKSFVDHTQLSGDATSASSRLTTALLTDVLASTAFLISVMYYTAYRR